MSAQGQLEWIHLADAAGQPMRSVRRATAVTGGGLAGDRYANGAGHWSPIRRGGQGLTLIEGEVVDALALKHGLQPGETRRNVTTRGIRLAELIGHEFLIGAVRCRAVRLCEPCSYLDGLLGRDVLPDLVHVGGIRVEIVEGGEIAVGDPVRMLPDR